MTTFTLDTLRDATLTSVSLVATSDMTPTAGEGTPIAPAVFAKGDNHPGGPAITRNTAQRTVVNGEGIVRRTADGSPVLGDSVMIDSVFSQGTRKESGLWDLRSPELLNLPGIIFTTPSRPDIEASVKKHYPKIAAKTSSNKVQTLESATEIIVGELEAIVPTMSSWTLAHRHVDGAIRSAVDADGNTLWHDGGEVYNRLQHAGPSHLSDLLKFSPNAVLFGFWASAMPVRHRLARNITATVTGYGATRLTGGAMKSTPLDISSHLEIKPDGNVTYLGSKVAKDTSTKPSSWGLGAVPATGTHLVTCDTIIADTAVSVAQLRRVLRSSDLTEDQADAASVALAGLGILSHTLTLETGFYRSGCDLVDRTTTWRSVRRGGGMVLDVPLDSADLISVVREALDAARALGVIGTSADSITLEMGQTMLDAVVCSSIEQLVKRSEGEAD